MSNTILQIAIVAGLLFFPMSHAQQAATSQPAQTQSQPCAASPTASSTASTNPPIKLSDDAKKKLDQRRAWLQKYSPIPIPDPTTIPPQPKSAQPPCPPAAKAEATAPFAHLPHDVVTTWLCNPVVTASDHTTSYVMPSDITEASPIQANAFEADSVKPDSKATTTCSSLHKDPKTLKFWLAQ